MKGKTLFPHVTTKNVLLSVNFEEVREGGRDGGREGRTDGGREGGKETGRK